MTDSKDIPVGSGPMKNPAVYGLLKDRVAIVTGASRGIGAATALRYAQEGARVVVNFIPDGGDPQAVVHQIEAAGGSALAMCADVTDDEAIQDMVEQTGSALGGRVDILVNNAFPGFIGGRLHEASWEDFVKSWEVIVRGAYNCCRAVLPVMMAQNYGRIINLGTTSMWELNPAHTPYITAKGALLTMTRALARDYGKFNITANMVTPSLVRADPVKPQPVNSPHLERTPLGRLAMPDDIAKVCVLLASELADFVSGVNLPVCGGMWMP